MEDDKHYRKGQLVRINIRNRCFTDDGFSTVSTLDINNNDFAIIFSEISLNSYPSCNDFLGEQTVVRHGDLATVLSFRGRPYGICLEQRWECYDVYEILIDGAIRNIFRYNIAPLYTGSDLEFEK